MAFGNATKGYVRAHSGGGGGGGTSNYNQLSNKPQINGVELTGNKTSEELHITGGGGITLKQCEKEDTSTTTTFFIPKTANLVSFSIIDQNTETYRIPYVLSIKSIENVANNGWSIAVLTHTGHECIISAQNSGNFYTLSYVFTTANFRMRDVYYI